jgi:hypothetical protein
VPAALVASPAAAWQEVPYRALPGGNVATCLHATGAEGGLAALGPLGRRAVPLDVLAAGTGRPAVRARVRFPIVFDCPAIHEAGGAGVAAAPAVRPGTHSVEMRAAVRDPGGGFGTPLPLGRAPVGSIRFAAAAGGRGDAIVAWIEERRRQLGTSERLVVARRAPHAPFGAVQPLTPWLPAAATGSPAVSIDSGGRATVVWAQPNPRSDGVSAVKAASAPAGEGFGPAQVLTRGVSFVERLTLVTAPGGAALLAHDGGGEVRLYERAASAAGFGPSRRLGSPDPLTVAEATDPAVALRDDGAAVVAWRQGESLPGVRAMTRGPGGAFGAEVEVAPGDDEFPFGRGFVAYGVVRNYDRAEPPGDTAGLQAALSGTGRVSLAWTAPRALPDVPYGALGAAGSLQDGFGAPVVLGSATRGAGGVAALSLPGGEPAVAWADNLAQADAIGIGDLEPAAGGGRIHVARADAAAAAPAPVPRASLRASRLQRLFTDQPIRVAVRCAAACDVRAFIRQGATTVGAGAEASFPGGRRRTLGLRQSGFGSTVLPRRPGLVTVRARISAPGSAATRTIRLRVRLAHRRTLPVPPPLGARAVRRGRSILVSWHTAFPARQVRFVVVPTARKAFSDLGAYAFVNGRGRTRFRVRLRPKRPDAVRRLVLSASDRENRHGRSVRLRVTR